MRQSRHLLTNNGRINYIYGSFLIFLIIKNDPAAVWFMASYTKVNAVTKMDIHDPTSSTIDE